MSKVGTLHGAFGVVIPANSGTQSEQKLDPGLRCDKWNEQAGWDTLAMKDADMFHVNTAGKHQAVTNCDYLMNEETARRAVNYGLE